MDDTAMPITRDHEALNQLVAAELLTAKQIAFATGYSTNYIYEFLNGRRNPTPRMFNDILRYAARFIPGDRARYARIAHAIVPLFVMDTPIQTHINFATDRRERSIEEIRRDVGVLCRDVGDVAGNHTDIFADGKVDASDAASVEELNTKVPLLVDYLLTMLSEINGRYNASIAGAGR